MDKRTNTDKAFYINGGKHYGTDKNGNRIQFANYSEYLDALTDYLLSKSDPSGALFDAITDRDGIPPTLDAYVHAYYHTLISYGDDPTN
jgi:hypothetical protein